MRFLVLRFFHGILLLVGVSLLSFLFLQLAPGNFFDEMRLNPRISHETVTALYRQYGLDKPLPVRYFSWLKSVAKGEWGVSFAYNSPVAPLLFTRSRNTLLLTGMACLLSWMIAIPAGVISVAMRHQHRWVDHIGTLLTTLLSATPDVLMALGILWIAVRTHWFHAGGMFSPGSSDSILGRSKDFAVHLAAPLAVLVLGSLPVLVRHVRAAMVDALNSPHVRAGYAHGISQARILFRHALPTAAPPIISLFGFSIGSLLSSSLLIEVIMNWPGLGALLLEAILARDVYVVIGAVMLSATLLVGGMLFADVILFLADPRIRTEDLA
jgi:peptide/nickel transport system permease protein